MTIYPKHEQHWPDHVIPRRIEEYVRENGLPPTTNRAHAKKLTAQDVTEAVAKAQRKTGFQLVDPRYFVATCFHEAGCENEWDTEIATMRAPHGFVTVGAYQISQEEAEKFGFKLEDMLDLAKATMCFVRLTESNRLAIRGAAGIPERQPDPDYTDVNGVVWKGGLVRAYLAITHNKGVGFMQKTVKTYGLNWDEYKRRNPTDNIVARAYAEDCITGGPHWPSSGTAVPKLMERTLQLKKPFMTGEDVKELQRYLGIAVDGVFGPKTKAAVVEFQEVHELTVDGVVGVETWSVVLSK